MSNIIIYVSSRNNYDMLSGEVLKNINTEGFEFINVDDDSSAEEIEKGKNICQENDIVFLENKSRGVQMATQTLIDFINDNNLRLDVGKNFSFGPSGEGGNLRLGGFYDQDGEYGAGINYRLAFGPKPKPRGPVFSTSDPEKALSFLQKKFKKGGRVKMFKGGLAGILKV